MTLHPLGPIEAIHTKNPPPSTNNRNGSRGWLPSGARGVSSITMTAVRIPATTGRAQRSGALQPGEPFSSDLAGRLRPADSRGTILRLALGWLICRCRRAPHPQSPPPRGGPKCDRVAINSE